jgi:hypothetical protein
MLIFVSERSRLPVLLPARQTDRLVSTLPTAVCNILAALGRSATDTIVWLATLPDSGPTGGFFRDRRAIEW